MKKACIILFLLILSVTVAVSVVHYQHAFSTEKWVQNPDARERMLSDMEKQVEIIGSSREEIEKVLGPPEKLEGERISFKISRREYTPEQVMVYYIGTDYADVLWLIIVMDEEDRAYDYFVDVS